LPLEAATTADPDVPTSGNKDIVALLLKF
jgi:hypothetical protein